MRLTGKTALVTGGASGLGEAICRRFAAEGAAVTIADVDAAGGTVLAEELGARFVRLDVTQEADWAAALTPEAAPDVLVNNAGITTLGSIEEVTLDQFRHEFEVDVVGVFLGCKYGVAAMKAPKGQAGGSSIINMSSMTGVRAQADLVAYNAATAAVTHMNKSVALHCARSRIADHTIFDFQDFGAASLVEAHCLDQGNQLSLERFSTFCLRIEKLAFFTFRDNIFALDAIGWIQKALGWQNWFAWRP